MKTGAASSSGVFYEAFCGDAAKYEAHLVVSMLLNIQHPLKKNVHVVNKSIFFIRY